MSQVPRHDERASLFRRVRAALVVLLILGLLVWMVATFTTNQFQTSAEAQVETIASEAPVDERADEDVSKEALAVRESRGVENSFGVTEAPREPAPELETEQQLASTPQQSLEPKELDQKAIIAGNVQIEIGEIQSVQAKAVLPGEISGPAVKVPVKITNGTEEPIISRDVVADVFFGQDLMPGIPLISSGESSFPITINPGEEARAFYVVVVPEDVGSSIRVTVNYHASEPVAVFDGIRPLAASE